MKDSQNTAILDTAIYDEVLEILHIFKFDFTDSQFETAQSLILKAKELHWSNESDFGKILTIAFTDVVASENQKLIVDFFKSALQVSNSLSESSMKLKEWHLNQFKA